MLDEVWYTTRRIELTANIVKRVENSPMARETAVKSLDDSYQKLKKRYLIPPCFSLFAYFFHTPVSFGI